MKLTLPVSLLLSLFFILSAHAQEDSLQATRYVMRSTLFGAGFNNVMDTYLSPLEYTGPEVRILHERMRMTHLMNGNVSTQSVFQLHASYAENISKTAKMYYGPASTLRDSLI